MKLVQVIMEGEPCNLSLDLGLGSRTFGSNSRLAGDQKPPVQLDILFPEMEEGKREEAMNEEDDLEGSVVENKDEDKEIVVNGTRDSCNNNGSTHKKLRLTKEQSLLLEDSFRKHPTLNSTQKHDLAKRLNLFPRQVEVWFQNKRARTKLKQTEVDYEYLKKFCENLRDENWKLKRELQELRSVKPLYMEVPKARALTVCPSCEKIMASDAKETAE